MEVLAVEHSYHTQLIEYHYTPMWDGCLLPPNIQLWEGCTWNGKGGRGHASN